MRPAKRVFDEGHALPRRNSASSYLPQIPHTRNRTSKDPTHGSRSTASRVESNLFSSSSIAKMLNNFDYNHSNQASSGGRTSSRPRWKTQRSTSATSMKNVNRRSSSGSGLSSASSQGSYARGGGYYSNGEPLGRASSSSSLTSFDDRFDHLYSYSSNLDLFEHQLFKAEKRRKSQTSQQSIHDGFDLNQETKWLMDRTDQLKEKNDREWVI